MNQPLVLPPRPRILVIALRRLGDVLLTTPLIRSLRRAWPDATLDVMVFANTATILDGNPDIDTVIGCPERPSAADSLALMRRLWRRYDLAISTQAGDRPSFFAIVAGRRRAAATEDRAIGQFKAMFMHRRVAMNSSYHRVDETLELARAIGIASVPEVVAPRGAAPSRLQPEQPYAVLHVAPFFRYKQWRRDGWRQLAEHLLAKGLRIVATGGTAAAERAYLDDVWRDIDVVRADGALTWPELATLLSQARVFAGPDTSVTHLAAATGCPTVTIYGPTDPRRWGPWPAGGIENPWQSAGQVQRRGNVWLIQNSLPCMPCLLEGCMRRVDSHSLCLDYMPIPPVLGAIDAALGLASGGGAAPQTPLFSA